MAAYQSCNSFVEIDGSDVLIVQYFKKSTEITVIIICASENVCKLVCVFHHWVGRSVSVTWRVQLLLLSKTKKYVFDVCATSTYHVFENVAVTVAQLLCCRGRSTHIRVGLESGAGERSRGLLCGWGVGVTTI